MPAKALALNTIGHNGFLGCHKCLQPGVTTKTQKGHVHTYPYVVDNPTGPLHMVQIMKQNAMEAIRNNSKKTVNGIRSPGSCLMFLPNYDICCGSASDYMHCVLLNVVHLLTSLWFDSTFSSEILSCSHIGCISAYFLSTCAFLLMNSLACSKYNLKCGYNGGCVF